MPHQPNRPEFPGLIALLAGALAIGSSGIFVRVSETGPTATAFWRGCLALPPLAVWAWLERRHRVSPAAAPGMAAASLREPLLVWAGVFFAGDLALWHASLVFTLILLPLALLQKFLPATAAGWWVLLGCAMTAQVLGQGLIAYALAHLPATFGAVGLYVQVVAAGVYAWLLLGERLAPVQIAGGAVVLAAIALARRARVAPGVAPSAAVADARGAQAQRASIQSRAARHSESR